MPTRLAESTYPILTLLSTPTEVVAFENRVVDCFDQSAFTVVYEARFVQVFTLLLHAAACLRFGIAVALAITAS